MDSLNPEPALRKAFVRSVIMGVGAALLLLLIYLGVLTWLQGREHAWDQTVRLWYWLLALAGGFGVQVGLFAFIQQSLRQRQASATASVAASGGISAGSMAACCAHHLSDVLPLLGLSGLAAFLANYQIFFIIVGILSNAVGITIMLETIQHLGLCPRVASWRWNMGGVKRGTMISAVFIAVVALLVTT